MALGIGAALNFLTRAVALNTLRGKKDDGLGDQENRKRLAARAFLEGYEPDKRLFAKGPQDDAPDIVIPEPLTEPVTNILPQQQRVIPQLVAPGVAGIAPGEEDTFILQEINRLDRNILAIAQAMEENAKIDAEYRASVIQQQKEQLAKRGQSRSRRRTERRKGFLGGLRQQAEQRRRALSGRLVSARNELGKGFAGYGALLALSEIKKREKAIEEFFNNIPENLKGLFEGAKEALFGPKQEPPTPTQPLKPSSPLSGSSYGVDIGALADATGAAEGQYTSIGTYLSPRFTGDKEVGRGLGKYQFMTYRGDVRAMVRSKGTEMGMSDADIEKLFAESERAGKVGEAASRKMLELLGEKGQDELFRRHVINTLTQIKRAYPNADSEFLVRRFAAAHISGDYNDLTSADFHGTTGAMHGDKIFAEYQRILQKNQSQGQLQSFALPSSSLMTPVQSLAMALPDMTALTEVLEPFVIDQRTNNQTPALTGVLSGSEEIPFMEPSTGLSPYASLFGIGVG
jgi:hypothetical protein